MGIPLSDVLPESQSIAAEFVCAVCTNVIPYGRGGATITRCSHVFCTQCLDIWLQKSGRCPTCSTSLRRDNSDDTSPLETSNSLAWRILGKLRVRCPLSRAKGICCNFMSDYSELHRHMTLAENHRDYGGTKEEGKDSESGSNASQTQAEIFKEQGNSRFSDGQMQEAIALYSRAIAAEPTSIIYWNNRAAAWLHVGGYKEAASDCRESLKLDASSDNKAHVRLSKAIMNIEGVERAFAYLHGLPDRLPPLQEEHTRMDTLRQTIVEVKSALSSGQPDRALRLLSANGSVNIPDTEEVELLRAKCYVGMGKPDLVITSTLRVLKRNSTSINGLILRAAGLYQIGGEEESKAALLHVKQALQLDPDHKVALRFFKHIKNFQSTLQKAKQHQAARAWPDAIDSLSTLDKFVYDFSNSTDKTNFKRSRSSSDSESIENDLLFFIHPHSPVAVNMFEERAYLSFRLKNYDKALSDSAKAVYYNEGSAKAHLIQAKTLIELKRFEEAASSLRGFMEIQGGNNHPQILQQYEKAIFEIKKVKRPNYYEIMNVRRVASQMEIRAAYKECAFYLHPDRAKAEDRNQREAEFKLLQEALDILGDPTKRSLYDEGYDKEAIEERMNRNHHY